MENQPLTEEQKFFAIELERHELRLNDLTERMSKVEKDIALLNGKIGNKDEGLIAWVSNLDRKFDDLCQRLTSMEKRAYAVFITGGVFIWILDRALPVILQR